MLVTPFYNMFCCYFLQFFYILWWKIDGKSCFRVKKQKQIISTNPRRAEHPFAGWNTQHPFYYFSNLVSSIQMPNLLLPPIAWNGRDLQKIELWYIFLNPSKTKTSTNLILKICRQNLVKIIFGNFPFHFISWYNYLTLHLFTLHTCKSL